MFWTKMNESTRTLLYSASCLSIVALALWFGATLNKTTASTEKTQNVVPAASFPADTGSLGPITDNAPGTPRDVTFTVTGVPAGAPTNVSADMTFGGAGLAVGHTWVGDVDVTLIAPNGDSHVLYASTGATTPTAAGDSSDLSGPYNFTDSAMGTNWWAAAFAAGATAVVPPGDYRTTQAGPQASTSNSPVTDMTPAFSGVADANGTWTMRFTDNAAGDTGAVMAANLTIDAGGGPPAGPAHVDFDGDSVSDYSVIRDESTPLNGTTAKNWPKSYRERIQMRGENLKSANLGGPPPVGSTQVWYIRNSNDGSSTQSAFGESINDFVVPADFDGDGNSDIAVWRGLASTGPNGAFFYIFNSSTSTMSTVDFGVQGDDPTVVADYDGDGKADPAVYRCGISDGQCNFFYKGSAGGGEITVVPWGFGNFTTLFPGVGDFDGDSKADFIVQRTNPSAAGQGQFVLLRSSDGGVEFIDWGLNTDLIIPGDYDGDGKSDIAVARNESGQRVWYILERDGGTSVVPWGLSTDFLTPGDYDGDGSTDIGVFRPDAGDPDNNFFFVLRSSDLNLETFEWGLGVDYPLANYQVH